MQVEQNQVFAASSLMPQLLYFSLSPKTSIFKMQMLLDRSFCDFAVLSEQLLVSGDLHTDRTDRWQEEEEEENTCCQGNRW